MLCFADKGRKESAESTFQTRTLSIVNNKKLYSTYFEGCL